MGGNLYKEHSRRHTADEYFVKTKKFLSIFDKLHHICGRFDLIPAYKTKPSFGDADIIYSTYNDLPLPIDEIVKVYQSNLISKNGDVISLVYNEMQIDLIHSSRDAYEYGLSYYKFNDFGNFCGKLTRYYGLKHSHKGLYLPIREPNGNLISEVLVTNFNFDTLKLVGLDTVTFEAGFETMEDVYRYIQSSFLFNPYAYKLENISSIGRMRDKKRDSYRGFLKFNESFSGPIPPVVKDKRAFLPMLYAYFPDLEAKVIEVLQKFEYKKAVQAKFNGDIVSSITGLIGRELGAGMRQLKLNPLFSPTMILMLSTEEIKQNIGECIKLVLDNKK